MNIKEIKDKGLELFPNDSALRWAWIAGVLEAELNYVTQVLETTEQQFNTLLELAKESV